jgi:hypothetical protein
LKIIDFSETRKEFESTIDDIREKILVADISLQKLEYKDVLGRLR